MYAHLGKFQAPARAWPGISSLMHLAATTATGSGSRHCMTPVVSPEGPPLGLRSTRGGVYSTLQGQDAAAAADTSAPASSEGMPGGGHAGISPQHPEQGRSGGAAAGGSRSTGGSHAGHHANASASTSTRTSTRQEGEHKGQKTRQRKRTSSVDPEEVAKFARQADTWWDLNGPHKGLHSMNPARLAFIQSAVCRHLNLDASKARPLEGLRVLDVGCGGGLLCEPLARLGAEVTGVDATEANTKVASLHAKADLVTASIKYMAVTAEELVEEGKVYDLVIASEVIEHVAEPEAFVQSLGALCRPGGGVAVSTINRTVRSHALAIVAAEYVLNLVPRGTHEWSKFVTPEELALMFRRSGLKMEELSGLFYNPINNTWSLFDDDAVNYIAFATKA
eukprot:jgi/Mesen1/2160/ME000152S01246